jgi:hypothetical protein
MRSISRVYCICEGILQVTDLESDEYMDWSILLGDSVTSKKYA